MFKNIEFYDFLFKIEKPFLIVEMKVLISPNNHHLKMQTG